jgi:hypothetical protein
MDLLRVGEFFVEHAENPFIKLTIRCLGFTAVGVSELVDFVQGNDEIWDMAGKAGIEPTIHGPKP